MVSHVISKGLLDEPCGTSCEAADKVHSYKLNINDGITAKYIGVIKGTILTTTYDTGYEDCVKGWFQSL